MLLSSATPVSSLHFSEEEKGHLGQTGKDDSEENGDENFAISATYYFPVSSKEQKQPCVGVKPGA